MAIEKFIGRSSNKDWDWNAFTTESSSPDLIRAQMRFVGSGGSSKANDPNTLPARKFTMSLLHCPAGRYAPSHSHEVAEHFTVLEGYLHVGWVYGDEVIEAKLGPGDLVLNKVGRPHGFRNDGPDPVLMSISVGSGKPLPPTYAFDPEGKDPAQARAFGALPGKTLRLDEHSSDPRHRDMAGNVKRASKLMFEKTPDGWLKADYVGGSGIKPEHYRAELVKVPPGVSSAPSTLDDEDVFLVLNGVVTVEWINDGVTENARLGAKEVIFNPPGQCKVFRNESPNEVTFLRVIGAPN
jgi:mannose-6-phosphate isomerase-like protein (cupin superfamily)